MLLEQNVFILALAKHKETLEGTENGFGALALVGPAETSRSSSREGRRQARHFTSENLSQERKHNNRKHKKHCQPYHFGPNCNLTCNCMPPPNSKGCDKRNGRCNCQSGFIGPHCEQNINGSIC